MRIGVFCFRPADVAKLLGVTRKAISKRMKVMSLTGVGAGKARRISRQVVEELTQSSARGTGPEQVNHYLRAIKAFCRWMQRTQRLNVNPFDTMELLNTSTDTRHARRELNADELQRLFAAAKASQKVFRGLSGEDRFTLYLVAATTGFRADSLASLTSIPAP
jgi:integrase/recombinase XerC